MPGVGGAEEAKAGEGGRQCDASSEDEDIEGIVETLEILSDPDLVEQIRKSQEDLRAGRVVPWVKDSAQGTQ